MFAIKTDQRGTTLAELVMVLALFGILVALAVPSFIKVYPSIRLKGDTRDVTSVLKLARMRAVAEGVQYGIFLDETTSPDRYILFKDVDGDDDFYDPPDEEVYTRDFYPKTVFRTVYFLHDVAIFKPDGSSNGGWVSLGVEGKEDSLMVDVLPSTGRVKVVQ